MSVNGRCGDVAVIQLEGQVIQCEIQRPPNHVFHWALIRAIAKAFAAIDQTMVLCSRGKNFCVGEVLATPQMPALTLDLSPDALLRRAE